jgi:glycosyltransferase involved in cell wall biosynthesis
LSRILAIHPKSELYGADRIFFESVSSLISDGYKVDIMLKQEGPLVDLIKEKLKKDVLIVPFLPVAVRSRLSFCSLIQFFYKNIKFFFYLFRCNNKYDIVYINTLALFTTPLICKILNFQSIILHSHEMISCYGTLAKIIVSLSEAFSSKVICVSNAVKQDMLDGSIIGNNLKYKVVHNGIKDMGKQKHVQHRKIKFLLLGRIMPEKGQWFLVETLKLLSKEELDKISIKLVGNPPPFRKNLLDDLKNIITKFKLNKYIDIIDFVNDPFEIISNCDVCLVPSIIPDSFPTTVLEGMSCAKPIIVSNSGGAKEIVVDGRNGILIEPNNINEFKSAIQFFISNPELIFSFGKASRKIYEDYLTLDKFKERFLMEFK